MNNAKHFIWLFPGALLIWLLIPAISFWIFPNMSERGQFGDLFGATNALFSGLAFAGFLYTVHLQQQQLLIQRKEFALQREELSLQREEMKASRGELANQVKMQRALLHVTIAQIAVAGINAEIEANKLNAEFNMRVSMSPDGISEYSKSIMAMSRAISELSNKLEADMPSID